MDDRFGQWIACGTRGYRILINTGKRQLTLLQDGKAVATYPVAVGKPSTPTPTGHFAIIEKRVNPGGPYGSRWMRFYNGYGIHGTNNPASIGRAVSRGCVRMLNHHINVLFAKVPIGTPVRIIRG